MTPIHRAQVDRLMTWHRAEFGKDAFALDLMRRHAAALADLLSGAQQARRELGGIRPAAAA